MKQRLEGDSVWQLALYPEESHSGVRPERRNSVTMKQRPDERL